MMQTALIQTQSPYLSDNWRRSLAARTVLCLVASLVVAAAAHISVPLWFTPVPLTLQPLAVLAVGLALGPVAGFAAMIAYLAEGSIGLPVFSPLGLGGIAQIFGPTGGFLMSYPFVAAVAGLGPRAFKRFFPRFVATSIACTLATTVLFIAGAFWFMVTNHISFGITFAKAVDPFLAGAGINIFLAAAIDSARSRSTRS